jgi:hypothetical protein
MNWREYAFALLGFSLVSLVLTYGLSGCRAGDYWRSVAQSAEAGQGWSRRWRGTRRLVYDQHQLAVLHAGNDDELPHADGRPGVSQLSFRGVGIAVPSRWFAASSARHLHHRQLLGGCDAQHALCAAAGER